MGDENGLRERSGQLAYDSKEGGRGKCRDEREKSAIEKEAEEERSDEGWVWIVW